MTIYFDIDGTLTKDGEHKWGEPVKEAVAAVKEAISAGHQVILWSARGGAYARDFAASQSIAADAYLPKPDVCFDDWPTIRPKDKLEILPPDQIWSWLMAHGVPRRSDV